MSFDGTVIPQKLPSNFLRVVFSRLSRHFPGTRQQKDAAAQVRTRAAASYTALIFFSPHANHGRGAHAGAAYPHTSAYPPADGPALHWGIRPGTATSRSLFRYRYHGRPACKLPLYRNAHLCRLAAAVLSAQFAYQQQRKFIAAQTECVIRTADAALQPLADLLQKPVTHSMAVSIVYRLEPVKVQIKHGKRLPAVVGTTPIMDQSLTIRRAACFSSASSLLLKIIPSLRGWFNTRDSPFTQILRSFTQKPGKDDG